jgi:hypothetical protein
VSEFCLGIGYKDLQLDPTLEKRLRVAVDWFIDLFFKRDVTRLKTLTLEGSIKARTKQTEFIS